MNTPMYTRDGQPAGHVDIPSEVVIAAATVKAWIDKQGDPMCSIMGLGLVDPHVACAKHDQTNHIMHMIAEIADVK